MLQSLLARPKACVFDIKTSASMAVPPWFALPWVSPGGSYRASTKRPSPIGTGLAQARRKIKTPKGKTLEFFKRTLTAATVPTRRTTMSKISIVGATLLAAAVLCAAPVSLHQSKDGLSLSQDKAEAKVGKPLSAGSVAGVNRRANRRSTRSGN